MTATLPAAAGTASPPAALRAARRARGPRRVLLHTPGKLWALLAGLVLLSLAWGTLGGWVATQHSSAADSVVSANERLSLDARHMYQSIADADATITAAFLASPTPPLGQLQRYENDLATAHGDLSLLQAADGSQAAVGPALAQLGSGLSAYAGYVGEATAEYAMGFPLTGGSFVQDASEEAHLDLLPAANTVFTQENAALNAANGQATELPTEIGLLVLAIVTGFAFYRAQRWLARRTNRVLSPGLVIASILLAVSVIWLAAGFASSRSDLNRGIGHGSAPAQEPGARQHRRPADQGRRGAQRHLPQRQRLLPGRLPRHEQEDRPRDGHLARRRGGRAGQRRPGLVARRDRRAGRDRLVRGQHPGVQARHGGQLRRRAEPGSRQHHGQHGQRVQRARG